MEVKFSQTLFEMYRRNEKYLIPRDVYNQTLNDLKVASAEKSTKSRHSYYILGKYEIMQCGDVEKLIKKRTSSEDPSKYYVYIEEMFGVIQKAHIATGHGGRDRMMKHLNTKYVNITRACVDLFKSYCIPCQEKVKRPKTTGVVVRPILSKDFGSRSQVDLIDMQSSAHSQYRWIMVYQCHLTKFCILRPLHSKRAAEVAFQLLDIFLLFGAPCILQSDNGSEFTAEIIRELKDLWPQLHLVHGKPRHPQSQGSVERANSDIKDMLCAWLSDNRTQDWAIGLKFVQNQKNSAYHCGIKCTPYSALFGCEPKVGLSSTNLPNEVILRLESEEDLIRVSVQSEATSLRSYDPKNKDRQPTETASSDSQPTETASSDSQPTDTASSDSQPTETASSDCQVSQPTETASSDSQPTDTASSDSQPAETASSDRQVSQPTETASSDSQPTETASSDNELTEATSSDSQPTGPTSNDSQQIDESSIVLSRQNDIRTRRKRARDAQCNQAERMVKRSRIDLKPAELFDNVAIPIPTVDRGRGDPRNILGVILDKSDNDLYTVAVKAGVLKPKYTRNEFSLCPQKLLTKDHVNTEKKVSLREALKKSESGGQGFIRCNCASSSSKKCRSKRCLCVKNNLKCNSRCHSSLSCNNK